MLHSRTGKSLSIYFPVHFSALALPRLMRYIIICFFCLSSILFLFSFLLAKFLLGIRLVTSVVGAAYQVLHLSIQNNDYWFVDSMFWLPSLFAYSINGTNATPLACSYKSSIFLISLMTSASLHAPCKLLRGQQANLGFV